MLPDQPQYADTLEDVREPNSSGVILQAIEQAERVFSPYLEVCRTVDAFYSRMQAMQGSEYNDEELDIFWASMEILKPAIYAKPPKPVASPRFKDGGSLDKTTSELIERCLESEFDRGDIDQVMLGIRDDLALNNRGVAWVTYEADEKGGGQRLCFEHLDRGDFLQEPTMAWQSVGWVARRGWLTMKEAGARFQEHSGEAYRKANYNVLRDGPDHRPDGSADESAKAGFWEVWSKVDNRVYWVSEGVDVILDETEPHLSLQRFFPCPKPAYGTLQRRTLIPVPDFVRYRRHLEKISDLTSRIYGLLDWVKIKGFFPAGGDIGSAVETLLKADDDTLLIPVPAAAFGTSSGGQIIQFMPLAEIATAIQGLIEARGQLIEDFYQLSGISDIMRGATEAEETLGAQQLKSQYGSVRVRDKIDELQRIAKDLAAIGAEIMAKMYSQKTLLELSRMKIPTKAEVKNKLEEVEKAAKQAMKELGKEAQEAAEQMKQSGQQVDPAQIEQQFQQRQAQIAQQYQPAMRQLSEAVVIEDVMGLLRDSKARNLVIDIETDSTILTDEMAEKSARGEFLNAFATASGALMPLIQMGEQGAKLAGSMLKFALQPFRINRELSGMIDDFVENAGQNAGQPGDDGSKELAAAQNKLAEAEMAKAQAQTMKVQADSELKAAELQRKMAEMQQKGQSDQAKWAADAEKLRQSAETSASKAEEAFAKVDLIRAQTMKALAEAGVVVSAQNLDEFKSLADIELKANEQAMSAEDRQRQAIESERNAAMGERQQTWQESQSDRQQTFAERQAEQQAQQGAE